MFEYIMPSEYILPLSLGFTGIIALLVGFYYVGYAMGMNPDHLWVAMGKRTDEESRGD